MVRGIAVPPQKMTFGRSRRARSRTSSRSTRPVSRPTLYPTGRNHRPLTATGEPWVRWPPIGSAMPIMVSPGLRKAR